MVVSISVSFDYASHTVLIFFCSIVSVVKSRPSVGTQILLRFPPNLVPLTTKPFSNDPSAGSPTDTLLRLLLPLKQGIRGSFQAPPFSVSQSQPLIICFISRSDGRCVQRAGTYSSQPDELQLQGIPRS